MLDYTAPAPYQQFGLDVTSTDQKFGFKREQDQIPLVTVDSLRLAPLLINVSGKSELNQIVTGSKKTIQQFEPVVVVCSSQEGDNPDVRVLLGQGYHMLTAHPHMLVYIPSWLKHVGDIDNMLVSINIQSYNVG